MNAPLRGEIRIGVDVGGTFTDFIFADSDGVHSLKVPTTPKDQSVGIMQGLEEADIDISDVGLLVHGTTAAINMVLQRVGSPTGLITTRGFRDIIELRLGARTRLCDPFLINPKPFIPRSMRLEVEESVFADGTIESAVERDEVVAVGKSLIEAGARSLVVAFINSYANPANERNAANFLSTAFPDTYVTSSAALLSLPDEYIRFTTATLNGYIKPEMKAYLDHLVDAIRARGMSGQLYLMHSAGGTMTLQGALDEPIALLESGPVAGVIAATDLLETLEVPDAIVLDIGGTTSKAAMIVDGESMTTTEYEVDARRNEPASGWPVGLPMVDIIEIGLGGGSIVAIDALGGLAVGPASAGADPGPACYGKGGKDLTLTDCAALLGILQGSLGGQMPLRTEAALDAARHLLPDRDPQDVAADAMTVAVASVADLLRELAVSRGFDPRDTALLGHGGAGPMLIGVLMQELGVQRGIVPPSPGTFSAEGLLVAPIRRSTSLAVDPAGDHLADVLKHAAAELQTVLRAEGLGEFEHTVAFSVGCRYVGQRFTLEVPIAMDELDSLFNNFHSLHGKRYGHSLPGHAVEPVTATAIGTIPLPRPGVSRPVSSHARAAEPDGSRSIRVGSFEGSAPVFSRSSLSAGSSFSGPAVVDDYSSTLLVPPRMDCSVHESGCLLLETQP